MHQTAALLVYPIVRLFVALQGSHDGLLLFLRVIYLMLSIGAALAWRSLLTRLFSEEAAWIGAACVVAFIPFGLPAPSYNTLGMQFLLIALGAYGCGVLTTCSEGQRTGWFAASACAWAISTVAYPSLVVVCGLHGLLAAWLGWRERSMRLYVASAFCAVLAAWIIVAAVLSPERLIGSISYLAAINNSAGLAEKVMLGLEMLTRSRWFLALFIIAAALGIARRRFDAGVFSILVGVVLTAVLGSGAAMYIHSHDAVLLGALMGLGLASGMNKEASLAAQTTAIVYTTSLVAGLVTTASATNTLYNFCIGGLPAATMAVQVLAPSRRFVPLVAGLALWAVLLQTSVVVHYGEGPRGKVLREPIRQGVAAGLSVLPDDAAVILLVTQDVNRLLTGEPTLAVFGSFPGIVLFTPDRLKMLSAFSLMPNVPVRGLEMTHEFYRDPLNRPRHVIIHDDPRFPVVNPMLPEFSDWYLPIGTFKTPYGRLSVFGRRSPLGSGS